MNPAAKLAAFGLVLAAVVGTGAVLGAAAGPFDVGDDDAEHDAAHRGDGSTTTTAHGTHDDGSELPAGGLLVAQDGYRFAPDTRSLEPQTAQGWSFRIVGPDGEPVQRYDILHDKELHLVVVSRDLLHYAHVHPDRAADGTWSVELPPLPSGSYRAFADFRPTGHDQLTLGVDLTVAGPHTPAPPAADSRTAEVDGYTVTLDGDPSTAGEVTVTVRRDGEVVTTEPYLGAAGHLVAIRDGDLAYLHVHPVDDQPAGPVRFGIEVPSAGRYALFFDFAHEGVVRTAPFVLTVGGDAAADQAEAPADDHGADGHDDEGGSHG